jgi:hypothetical protein
MAIATTWYNTEETIILVRHEPGWTWDEFRAAVRRNQTMIRTKSYPVHIICDMRGTQLPGGAFLNLRDLIKYTTSYPGQHVVVVDNPSIQLIYNSFARAYASLAPKQYIFVATLEHALHVLGLESAKASPSAR